MANFSQNQVRQLYVVLSKATTFDATTPVGALAIGNSTEDAWLTYVTPNGDLSPSGTVSAIVRSDLIPLDKVESAVATSPKSRPLKRQEIVFDTTINTGNPIVGQEYILRFTFYNLGMGGPENQYIKDGGAYKVRTGNTAANVYENLVELAKLNFSREPYPYVKVTTDTYDPYTMSTKPGTSTKIIVEEVLQPWVLGKRQASMVNFNINTVPVIVDGGYYPWGTVTDTTSTNTNVLTNGRMVADMEWFFLGERADQFRGMGYPDNFESIYLADPAKEYRFIDIQYYYAGNNEDVQKSQKYITLAIPTDSTYTAAALIGDLTTAGITVVNKL